MSSEVGPPSRRMSVTWIGQCECGHHISQRLPVTREDRPDVWVACKECSHLNNLSETEARHP